MKKAWELEYDVLHNAKPVILSEEEQTWKTIQVFEDLFDQTYKMKWFSRVPGSGAPERVIIGGIQSMENMGYIVDDAEKLIPPGLKALAENDMPTLIKVTNTLWHMFDHLKKNPSHPYHNFTYYETYQQYKQAVIFPDKIEVDPNSKSYYERTKQGWLAQLVGGAFGTALEGYTLKNLYDAFGDIHHYVRQPNTYNDDITYEIAFLEAFNQYGYDVTSEQIALEWLALVPFGWSAEEIALKNLQAGIFPPMSGYFNNPYREWIGAQMRGAICGMVAPGNPELAAELAFKDAVVSHANNGVLGEIFNAVMVSLAYVENDIKSIIETAINAIPKDSEYYSILKLAYDASKNHTTWQKAWHSIEHHFKKYNWVHAYPNAACEIIALYYGNGDFDETLHIIGMLGYDVDCNAAQIMTVIGIIYKNVPQKWTTPLGETIYTYCRKYKTMDLSFLTDWTVNATKKAHLSTL